MLRDRRNRGCSERSAPLYLHSISASRLSSVAPVSAAYSPIRTAAYPLLRRRKSQALASLCIQTSRSVFLLTEFGKSSPSVNECLRSPYPLHFLFTAQPQVLSQVLGSSTARSPSTSSRRPDSPLPPAPRPVRSPSPSASVQRSTSTFTSTCASSTGCMHSMAHDRSFIARPHDLDAATETGVLDKNGDLLEMR